MDNSIINVIKKKFMMLNRIIFVLAVLFSASEASMGKVRNLYFEGGNIDEAINCTELFEAEQLCNKFCSGRFIVQFELDTQECVVKDITETSAIRITPGKIAYFAVPFVPGYL